MNRLTRTIKAILRGGYIDEAHVWPGDGGHNNAVCPNCHSMRMRWSNAFCAWVVLSPDYPYLDEVELARFCGNCGQDLSGLDNRSYIERENS